MNDTKSAPTPGPWTANAPVEGHVSAGDRSICSAMGLYDGKDSTREENMANARLIAAAPALLTALKETREALAAAMRVIASTPESADLVGRFLGEITALGIPNGWGVRADAAIAKAEGRD